MIYEIERLMYHDEYGNITIQGYHIRYQKRFWGIFPYYSYVRDYSTKTTFKSQEEAEQFVKHILSQGKKWSAHSKNIVATLGSEDEKLKQLELERIKELETKNN